MGELISTGSFKSVVRITNRFISASWGMFTLEKERYLIPSLRSSSSTLLKHHLQNPREVASSRTQMKQLLQSLFQAPFQIPSSRTEKKKPLQSPIQGLVQTPSLRMIIKQLLQPPIQTTNRYIPSWLFDLGSSLIKCRHIYYQFIDEYKSMG